MRRLWCVLAIAAFYGCDNAAEITKPQQSFSAGGATHYAIVKLSANLGGTSSRGDAINSRGWVAGFSNLTGNGSRHAALWRDGTITDLLTLGGPSSNVQWEGLNELGMVVGISETADLDTLNEAWSCTAFIPASGHVCVGFVWERGSMRALPTFGGENGFATGVNNWGVVVGWAETPVHDPTCDTPQVLQFRAAMWEPRRGAMHELRPLPNDSASAATAINDRGEVVGISGDCDVAVGEFSARHAVIWEHGRPIDIGNIGGSAWNTPMAINETGTVVGFANLPGADQATFNPHGFIWKKGGAMKDLNALDGDPNSQALGVNDRDEAVGVSQGPNGNRAVIWKNGHIYDLNMLAQPASADVLLTAHAINDAGVITGNVLEQSSGHTLTYVAIPTHGSSEAANSR